MKFRRPEARNNQTDKGGKGLRSSSRLKFGQSQEDEAAISINGDDTRKTKIKSVDENVSPMDQAINAPHEVSSQQHMTNIADKSRG